MGQEEKLARLALAVKKLKKQIGPLVKKRVGEFKSNKHLFSELCFCILTANYTAEGGIRIQKGVKDFSCLSEREIERKLRQFGHRFPRTRANYIFNAIGHKKRLGSLCSLGSAAAQREWLVKNVKGLGYKEASHFLRNTGVLDAAIIDRHIIYILRKYRLITPPKTITKNKYLEIEQILRKLSDKTRIPLGELDLYLWHMKTGKVLK